MPGAASVRLGHRRLDTVIAVLGLAAIVLATAPAPPVSTTTALFTGSDASASSVTAATLDPPTSLAASVSGLTVTLTWTASVDAAVATGYQVHRGTVSGGPYGQVGSVTPATATTTTNIVPAAGTYHYVLRTYAGGAPWTSAASNQASVTTQTDTGLRSCASNLAVPNPNNGDGNGYQTNPAEACDTDGTFAQDPNSGTSNVNSCTHAGKDRHTFWTFTLGVPGTATSIDGLEVRGRWRADANGGSPSICARLSWDGGASWTTDKQQAITNMAATYTLGSASDTWGRTWTGAELANATFRVRITNVSTNNNRDFLLDALQVRVTYTP